MFRADLKYAGTIAKAEWMESAKGTNGLELQIEVADAGVMFHTLWFTDKTKESNAELLAKLGVTREQLRSGTFMQYELPTLLVGKEVGFKTKSETYKDKTQIKVSALWVKSSPTDERGAGYAVASMFGGTEEPDTTGANLSDDDIPF